MTVVNINSEAACRKAYLNYHCYGNTMGISDSEMGEITQVWKDKLSSWQSTVSNDENQYEFDDSDFEKSKAKGREQGEKSTGYDGNNSGDKAIAGIESGLSVAGALGATVGKKVGEKIFGTLGQKTAKSTAKAAGQNALKKSGSWSIAAPLALATGTIYQATKPNKEAKEACDQLQNEMANAQGALAEQQSEMERMSDELISLSDEANEYNEDANENIEEQKSEYDMYLKSFMELKEKAESGEPLTDEEKELYKELVKLLGETGENITETQEDTTDVVGDIYDDMGTYQEGYDYAAETMGEVEGLTDYAESFDSSTRTLCYIEAAAQGLNALSGGKAAVQAGIAAAASMGFNAWAWACAAMGAAGAVMSGIGAKQQFQWAGEVGNEIDARKATQDVNTQTMDVYTEEVDAYDGFMTGVEDLELEIPDDIEPPEDTELPPDPAKPPVPEDTPEPLKPNEENPNKKKEDEAK